MILVKCRRKIRLVSFIMQSLYHAMRPWVSCNIEWQSRRFASAEDAFHPGAGQWSGSQSPYQRRMLQGAPFTIDCSSLAQRMSRFRTKVVTCRDDFEDCRRSTRLHGGAPDIRDRADRVDRADGDAAAAMLRKDSGRQQTCLRHKEKTWGNSDPPIPLILPPISCCGYIMVGSCIWPQVSECKEHEPKHYFELNARHHIDRISLHRLYRLPRLFEVLVFSDGYGYCKDILQQARIEPKV